MIKTKTKSGYIAYTATALEVTKLGGYGVCDECNKAVTAGYLIPVMNHFMCPECFEEWDGDAVYYPEDIPYEERTAEYYERVLGGKTGG